MFSCFSWVPKTKTHQKKPHGKMTGKGLEDWKRPAKLRRVGRVEAVQHWGREGWDDCWVVHDRVMSCGVWSLPWPGVSHGALAGGCFWLIRGLGVKIKAFFGVYGNNIRMGLGLSGVFGWEVSFGFVFGTWDVLKSGFGISSIFSS